MDTMGQQNNQQSCLSDEEIMNDILSSQKHIPAFTTRSAMNARTRRCAMIF